MPPDLRQASADNESAQLGTRLHAVAERVLHGITYEQAFSDMGMADVMPQYRGDIERYVEECDISRWPMCGVEDKLSMPLDDGLILTGIVDFWGYDDGTLKVVDLKTGHIDVEARDNAQLLIYASLVVYRLQLEPSTIVMAIVQRGRVTEWQVSFEELRSFLNRLKQVAGEVKRGGTFSPGPHCRYCPAAIVCDAAHEFAVATARSEFDVVDVDEEDIAERLDVIHDVILPYVNAVRDAAVRLMQRRNVPRWRLLKRRKIVWADGITPRRVLQLLRRNGISAEDITASLSPAHVRRLMGKDVPESFTKKIDNGLSLRRDVGDVFEEEDE